MINTIPLADLSSLFTLSVWQNVFLVCLVLGFLIFIHEFGHFIVAKMCGVKCEKFYVGFDFFGWKLCSFQWGETEYGIGVFPLGGYVKMLGQEDNPGELREEYERSKLAIYKSEGDLPSEEELNEQREVLHSPRSYLAKPVWQRMAIIVAGVTMNAIFAYVAGVLAFTYGIYENPAEISVVPGSPAWNKGLQSGDTIVSINGAPTSTYSKIQQSVALSGKSPDGLLVALHPVSAPDKTEYLTIPTRSNGMNPTIGILPADSLKLFESMPASPGTPAAAAFYSSVNKNSMTLPMGAEIKSVDGKPVSTYSHLAEYMRIHRSEPITLEVEYVKESDKKPTTQKYVIQPRPMNGFGLVMKMGKITGVRPGSPAELAGVQVNDVVTRLDDIPVSDPVTFPQLIEKRLYELDENGKAKDSVVVTLTVNRTVALKNNEKERDPVISKNFAMEIRPTEDYSPVADSSIAIPELGISYEAQNVVSYVMPGSPAEEAGVKAGTEITGFQILGAPYPKEEKIAGVTPPKWESLFKPSSKVTLSDKHPNWITLINSFQTQPDGTKVKLFTETAAYELSSKPMTDFYAADRGISVYVKRAMVKSQSFGEAVTLGFHKTNEMFTLVFKMIHRLSTQEVSMKGLGGPVMLVQYAYQSANMGLGVLMLFACMVSANLAVFNLLPIPVVDGGHVVFLAWEGITGNPPPQNLMIVLSYMGLFLLLALMVWTLLLDCGFISRFN